ncbi:MAG: pentapeptide repeat-containing protein, partial [Pseudomonadota bacterium]
REWLVTTVIGLTAAVGAFSSSVALYRQNEILENQSAREQREELSRERKAGIQLQQHFRPSSTRCIRDWLSRHDEQRRKLREEQMTCEGLNFQVPACVHERQGEFTGGQAEFEELVRVQAFAHATSGNAAISLEGISLHDITKLPREDFSLKELVLPTNMTIADKSVGQLRGVRLLGVDVTVSERENPTQMENSFIKELRLKTKIESLQIERSLVGTVNAIDSEIEGLNLSESVVGCASFVKAHLTHANFSGASLTKANFKDARFFGTTDFRGANLTGATFSGARFEGAVLFDDADLSLVDDLPCDELLTNKTLAFARARALRTHCDDEEPSSAPKNPAPRSDQPVDLIPDSRRATRRTIGTQDQ